MFSIFSVFPTKSPHKLSLPTATLRVFIYNTMFWERTFKFTNRRRYTFLLYANYRKPNVVSHISSVDRWKMKNLPPPTAEKRLIKCGFDPSHRRKIYLLSFGVTKEVKLSVFQFKLIHNILSTNSLLYKMKIIDSPSCPFSPDTEQSISHLFNFVRCSSAVYLFGTNSLSGTAHNAKSIVWLPWQNTTYYMAS